MQFPRALVFLAALLAAAPSFAQQSILQGGPWAPGHAPQYVGQGFTQPIVQDAGGSSGGGLGSNLSEIGITSRSPTNTYPSANSGNGPHGEHACMFDAPTNNATGYHYLCFDPNALGGGLIDFGAAGNAGQLPLTINLNGVSYPFPFSGTGTGNVTGPTASLVNDIPLFNATNGGLIKDSGLAVQSPFTNGAKCDGSTIDTAAFTTSIAAGQRIELPAFVSCVINPITIGANQTLDCHGSVLIAGPGALGLPLLKKTGSNARVERCVLTDPNSYSMVTTHTNQIITGGTTTIYVSSTANLAPLQIVTIQTASGAYWTNKILAVGAGYFTVARGVPWTMTANPTVSAGGSGYTTGQEIIINGPSPTAPGGPATGHITASAGAITAVTLDVPGLWTANPGTSVAVSDPAAQSATGAALTIATGTVNSGAIVNAAFGLYTDDLANNGFSNDIQIVQAPVGVQLMNSTATGGYTNQETMKGLTINGISMVGLAKMVNVSGVNMTDVHINGYTHNSSAYGACGVFSDGDGPVQPSGGNNWDVIALGFEIGLCSDGAQLDTFTRGVFDTIRNYAVFCLACAQNDFNYLDATFTGPNATQSLGSSAGQGGGVVFTGSATTNTIGKFTTHDNAFDVHFGDQSSGVQIASDTWSWSNITSGFTNSFFKMPPLFGIASTSTLTGSSTYYLTPTSASTTEVASVLNGTNGVMPEFLAAATVAPSVSTSFVVSFRINHLGSGSFSTVAACSIPAGSTACAYTGPGVKIYPADEFDVAVTPVGGSFPANEQINVVVNRM